MALIARDAGKFNAATNAVKAKGIEARGFPADAGDAASLDEALASIRAVFGDAEVLLYNAALWRPGPVMWSFCAVPVAACTLAVCRQGGGSRLGHDAGRGAGP